MWAFHFKVLFPFLFFLSCRHFRCRTSYSLCLTRTFRALHHKNCQIYNRFLKVRPQKKISSQFNEVFLFPFRPLIFFITLFFFLTHQPCRLNLLDIKEMCNTCFAETGWGYFFYVPSPTLTACFWPCGSSSATPASKTGWAQLISPPAQNKALCKQTQRSTLRLLLPTWD